MRELHSFTQREIDDATFISNDGSTASFSTDALFKLSARFGSEIRWKINNPNSNEITLIDEQGISRVLLGDLNVSLNEDRKSVV